MGVAEALELCLLPHHVIQLGGKSRGVAVGLIAEVFIWRVATAAVTVEGWESRLAVAPEFYGGVQR